MTEHLDFGQTLLKATKLASEQRLSRRIDPLAYSLEFEALLLPKITLFQATLDYVALQLQSSHQLRVLTRLEHSTLAASQLAFDRSESFGLSSKERESVSGAFLLGGVQSALKLIVNPSTHYHSLEQAIKRLGGCAKNLDCYKQFLPWDDQQNLSDFLDLSCTQDLKLQEGNKARKLHFLCQLSVFTSTPKHADDYPLSVLVRPDEYFSLSTMWARKPKLWSHNAILTQSGKLITCKPNPAGPSELRKDLGLLADLYLKLGRIIEESSAR